MGKYIKKGGNGGARKGAGRPREVLSTNTELEVHVSNEEIINDIKEKIKGIRQRNIAFCMTTLDCDAKTFRQIYDLRLLPPNYYEAEQKCDNILEQTNQLLLIKDTNNFNQRLLLVKQMSDAIQ